MHGKGSRCIRKFGIFLVDWMVGNCLMGFIKTGIMYINDNNQKRSGTAVASPSRLRPNTQATSRLTLSFQRQQLNRGRQASYCVGLSVKFML